MIHEAVNLADFGIQWRDQCLTDLEFANDIVLLALEIKRKIENQFQKENIEGVATQMKILQTSIMSQLKKWTASNTWEA